MFKKTDNLVRGGVSYTQCKFLSSILSIIGILYSKSCFKTFFSWVHWRRRQWGSFRQRSAVKLGGSEQNTDSKALGVLLSSLHFLPSSSFSFYSLPSLLCMHRCLIHFVRVVGRPPAQGQFWPVDPPSQIDLVNPLLQSASLSCRGRFGHKGPSQPILNACHTLAPPYTDHQICY